MIGKIYRRNSGTNYHPYNISDNNRILSSVSTPSPPVKNNEPCSKLSIFKGKNQELFEVKPKIQLNRQLFPKIKLTYAATPYGLYQNNAMKSDLPGHIQ